ncbi:MFS transporter, partial [Brachybacterium sp. ACRRE]|uniref:MFS transporter n=1 Tax=Brachybacterium sp. ACRRE TaxID=2918184 RepID=UPI001EF1B097
MSAAEPAAPPVTGGERVPFLDRLGIPHPLRWGFLGVLIFMTGNGVESNFVSPHIAHALGGSDPTALAARVIACYSAAVLIGSYLAGALADLIGPRRVMAIGFGVWVVFEMAFLGSLQLENVWLVGISYFLRGFGFPLFAFAFLVWINHVVDKERNGAAVGWFYVMFTGGLPTLGSLVAFFMIPAFGGDYLGEKWTMLASTVIVLIGFLVARFGVHEEHGSRRLAPAGESPAGVILSGLRLTFTNGRIAMGFLTRLINTAPEFGMFIILPNVIYGTADQGGLGWSQSQWFIMTTVVYAGNILFNAAFGALGDKVGWVKTVRWFG